MVIIYFNYIYTHTYKITYHHDLSCFSCSSHQQFNRTAKYGHIQNQLTHKKIKQVTRTNANRMCFNEKRTQRSQKWGRRKKKKERTDSECTESNLLKFLHDFSGTKLSYLTKFFILSDTKIKVFQYFLHNIKGER